MPHENPSRIPTFVPLAIAAVVTASAVVACDRTSTRATAPESFANGEGARGAQPAPAPASQTPPSSPLPPRDALNDTVITGKIKAAILNDPGMGGADVSVNTDRGVVVLTGLAKNQEQVAMASAHAQRQDGVLRVDTHLSVNQ